MKKQFNLKIVLLSLISITALYSCSNLELEATDSVIQDVTFTGLADTEESLNGLYSETWGMLGDQGNFFALNEVTTDEQVVPTRGSDWGDNGQWSSLHDHKWKVDHNFLLPTWNQLNSKVLKATQIISPLSNASSQEIAEAKFLRAYAYFNLVRLYGGVPLVTTVVGSDEKELLFTRVDEAIIYEQIVADLQEGVTYLDNTNKSRASKAAAQGILAKVYLTKPTRNYAGAKQLCEDIMNSGFSLESNFKNVFYNELNNEIIFAVQYLSGNPDESQGFSSEFTSYKRQGRQDGLNIVNPNLAEDFIAFGGNRTSVSYAAFGDDADLPVPLDAEVIKFLPDGYDISDTNLPTYGGAPSLAGNDWIILRYSDVLLMHAEAIMEDGDTPNASAIDSYMEVRVRAGFDAVSDRPSVLTKDALLLERRVELAFENHRFFDLLRLGVAHDVLGAHAATMGYSSYNIRRLLLPIPSREINLSDGILTQNPQ